MLKGPSPYPSRPEHPRVKAVDETRTVIRVNFVDPEKVFCLKHRAKRVTRAIQESNEAAIDFIRNPKDFSEMNAYKFDSCVIYAVRNNHEAAFSFIVGMKSFYEKMHPKSFFGVIEELFSNNMNLISAFRGGGYENEQFFEQVYLRAIDAYDHHLDPDKKKGEETHLRVVK